MTEEQRGQERRGQLKKQGEREDDIGGGGTATGEGGGSETMGQIER